MAESEARISTQPLLRTRAAALWLVTVWLLPTSLSFGAEAKVATPRRPTLRTAAQKLENKWGIQVESLRLSANGYLVDFRYRVTDPEKAAALGDPGANAYLVDRATGARLTVPSSPKVGPLRQSAENLTAGRVYFALFSNAGRAVKPGGKVTVVIGDFKADNLAVQ